MHLTPRSSVTGLRQSIDGVLLLDKPSGITSNSALQCAKRLLQATKVGHVGTLDPLASGLLPLCFGEATKFSGGMFLADKSYLAEVTLGLTTTTGDAEGEVLSRSSEIPQRSEIEAVVPRFIGPIMQTPPMYSALKRNGKPLYAYARAGEKIEIEPRPVVIHDIHVLSVAGDRLQLNVRCGKGTYIRTLAEDIGHALGCGASLSGLRRTTVGAFEVAASIGLEELEADNLEQLCRSGWRMSRALSDC
jgi:tRNA pseudouridine55 synthase